MLYHAVFPESVIASMHVPDWNLGEVCVTEGFADLLEDTLSAGEFFSNLLASQLRGDYGLINSDAADLQRTNQARREGRPFTGIFVAADECIKIVTQPTRQRTVICLMRED